MPIVRSVRNTIYEWWINRTPFMDVMGVRTSLKNNIKRQTIESLKTAFEKIIRVSMDNGYVEVSAIILVDRWTGELYGEGVVIDTIGEYAKTKINIQKRLEPLPSHIAQIRVHTHPEADVMPSSADLKAIQKTFNIGIDDIHFIISYDFERGLILTNEIKNIIFGLGINEWKNSWRISKMKVI